MSVRVQNYWERKSTRRCLRLNLRASHLLASPFPLLYLLFLDKFLKVQTAPQKYSKMGETQVIIIGCGPTGALLSAYLGRQDVKNVVLEKEPDITTDPRGIALDEDGIRAVQGLGLYGRLWDEIGMRELIFVFKCGDAGFEYEVVVSIRRLMLRMYFYIPP